MKFLRTVFLNLLVLGNLHSVYSQTSLELEVDKLRASLHVKTAEACLFGRLPKNDQTVWVHLDLSSEPLNSFLSILKRPGLRVAHSDGPFGADSVLKARVVNSNGSLLFTMRIWNETISIERPNEKAISFECLDLNLRSELRAFVSSLAAKKSINAKVREAKSYEELLDQLALGDPQVQ